MMRVVDSPYMTVEECSAYVRLALSTIYKKVNRGEIPARKHGGKLLFHKGDIDAWSLEKSKLPVQSSKLSKFQSAKLRLSQQQRIDAANGNHSPQDEKRGQLSS